MLDFSKPMKIRGTGYAVRYVGPVNRAGSSSYNYLFIQTSANGTEDILWRTVDGKHQQGMEQYDVINAPVRREVHINLNRRELLNINADAVMNVPTITAYGRPELLHHDEYDSITLTYEGDKLIDVSFILQG